MESFRSVPTCAWTARIVLRKSRANQTPAARKANCASRLPAAYQLKSDQELMPFMFLPLGRDRDYVSSRKGRRKLAGGPGNGQVCCTVPVGFAERLDGRRAEKSGPPVTSSGAGRSHNR